GDLDVPATVARRRTLPPGAGRSRLLDDDRGDVRTRRCRDPRSVYGLSGLAGDDRSRRAGTGRRHSALRRQHVDARADAVGRAAAPGTTLTVEIGFFFWPYDVALVRAMAAAATTLGYDMVGIADTPGIAMDPWVATTILAENVRRARVAVCVTNLVTRHPAIAAASIASVDLLAPGRAVLGIGVGHSGTRNLGTASLPAAELVEGAAL